MAKNSETVHMQRVIPVRFNVYCVKSDILLQTDSNFLLRQIELQRKKYNIFLEIITLDSTIYRLDHSDFIAFNFMGNSIGLKRVNCQSLTLLSSALILKSL